MTNSHILKNIFFLLSALVFGLACKAVSSFSLLPQTTPTASVSATPTLSSPPSEGWIAFVDKNNVWLIHPDGSGLRQVTDNPVSTDNNSSNDINIKWSPDGQKLAFSQNNHLYVLDIATFTSTLVVDNTNGGFDWSLTSKQLMYDTVVKINYPDFPHERNNGLWVVNLETVNKRKVVKTSDTDSAIVDPIWSREGSHVIFSDWSIYTVDSAKIIELNSGSGYPVNGSNCVWAPSELIISCLQYELAFDYWPPSNDQIRMIIQDQDGKIIQEILLSEKLTSEGMPKSQSWSPDGEEIAIRFYNTNDKIDLFSLRSGTSNFLTNGTPWGWSPDSQWILVEENHSSSIGKLTILNVNSGLSFPLGIEGTSAVWQPLPKSAGATPVATIEFPIILSVTPSISSMVTDTPSSTSVSTSDVSITIKNTSKGDLLQINADGNTDIIGPVEKGSYALGPNSKFLVYCTNSGIVYAARIGDTNLTKIGSVKDLAAIIQGEAPQVDFQFFGNNPYTVQIHDSLFNQDETLSIPSYITR